MSRLTGANLNRLTNSGFIKQKDITTLALATTAANSLMAKIHNSKEDAYFSYQRTGRSMDATRFK